MQREDRLLFDVLDRHEAHVWPPYGLADSLRVRGIVLVRLDVWLDELRRHEPHGVPDGLKLSGPVVRTRASLHSDQTRRHVGKRRHQLLTTNRLLEHGTPLIVHSMKLEHVLGQV
jgi:hypothetical protein